MQSVATKELSPQWLTVFPCLMAQGILHLPMPRRDAKCSGQTCTVIFNNPDTF